jgi:hypothetical protein
MAVRRKPTGSAAMNNPLRILQTLDLADIGFLLSREPLSADQLGAAFARARVTDLPETQALFLAAQPKVLALASKRGGPQPG